MFKGLAYGALRNFVEGDAPNLLAILVPLLFLFLGLRGVAKLLGKMGGDGFAFAVGVRRQIDRVHADRQFLQLGDDFLFAGNDDVLSLEIVVGIDTESAFRQIFDVAERSLDGEAFASIFLDRLGLSRRFDDN